MTNKYSGIRIVSEGNPIRTKVIDLSTGKEISGVKSIEFKIDANQKQSTALLEVYLEDIDVKVPGNQFVSRDQTIQLRLPHEDT